MNQTKTKNPPYQQNQQIPSKKLTLSSQNQNSSKKESPLKEMLTLLKESIHNQLKLKKIIQKAQKIDLMNNVPQQNKINIERFFFVNLFLGFNITLGGILMFSHPYYRKLKYLAFYALGIAYLGLSFGIFWQDHAFFDRLSTKQDAYKSEIKYVLRKQCLQNVSLKRLQNKKQTFKKLNHQFQQFHQVQKNSKIVSLLQ